MAKLIEITGKALSGEWGTDDETGCGIPVLRTTNFTNEGIVNYSNVVTRTITKKKIAEKYLRQGDIIIEKSGGSDKQPVGRVIYFDGPDSTYLFNNFTGLLRVKDRNVWYPRYVFYSLFFNYRRGGTKAFENKTTGLHNLNFVVEEFPEIIFSAYCADQQIVVVLFIPCDFFILFCFSNGYSLRRFTNKLPSCHSFQIVTEQDCIGCAFTKNQFIHRRTSKPNASLFLKTSRP